MVDTVVINTANEKVEPSLEEQAKAAGIEIESVDSTATEQTAKGMTTDEGLILGKFKSVEELAKSYEELQKKLGQPKASDEANKEEAPKSETSESKGEEETKEEASTEETKADTEKSPEEVAKEATEQAGLNLEELSDKYWEKGELEATDYEALEKAGYPRTMVDQFIEGQKAIVENETLKVHNSVGGSDAYAEMIAWAKDSLSQAEIAAYDRAVNSDNMDDVITAVKGLKARMVGEVGNEPSRTVSGRTAPSAEPVFNSVAELTAAIGDPRYAKDPAYRASVEQRLARSNIL